MRRVGIFGWGVVAPKSPNIEEFAKNLAGSESWLSAFDGFGPDRFLVGNPSFDFNDYKPWIDARFAPSRYRQLIEKADTNSLYAIGAFIQALGQNPGLEGALSSLGEQAHVYVGTGLGSLNTAYDVSVNLYRAQRRWNRFWSEPSRNPALASYLTERRLPAGADVPEEPEAIQDPERREMAEDAWFAFWAARSSALSEYLDDLGEIESMTVEGEVKAGKLALLREKSRRLARLNEKWSAPEPPWTRVSPNLLWNISNAPAAQITMLGHISGLSFAPVAACSTFGVALKLAMDSIDRGQAKLVVVGATDGAPNPLSVAAFYNARVHAADGQVSKPLSGLRGTHVSGGACVWIVGDLEYAQEHGFRPLGLEPVAVGTTSDAEHIITPSEEGPRAAIRQALTQAGCGPEELVSWDLHATATPGDHQEVENLRHVLGNEVIVTARKGTFGHGMAAAGGWELTAQYLGCASGALFPTPLSESELNPEIRKLHERFAFREPLVIPRGPVGKLSMGVGGINACVISRPWDT
ncbi:MAG TPA: beta-ketoacyl synthase N-terminal-like domain-containing protein [Polyangiaceae bacterium]|nr:beta-ketoacyl synthase N-terminal-like domain-containing protein [Polyangiaceae bacterium]